MACSGFNIARVYFKYPGEDWQNVKSVHPEVFYKIETITTYELYDGKGQCVCMPYKVYFTVSNVAGHSTPQNYMITAWGPIGAIRTVWHSAQQTWDTELYCRGRLSFQCASPQWALVARNNTFRPNQPTSAIVTDIQPNTSFLDNCAIPVITYKFTVWDASGTLYTRTASNYPSAYYECGESCPPETCRCQQRSGLVCCYDEQGFVVKSFYP